MECFSPLSASTDRSKEPETQVQQAEEEDNVDTEDGTMEKSDVRRNPFAPDVSFIVLCLVPFAHLLCSTCQSSTSTTK